MLIALEPESGKTLADVSRWVHRKLWPDLTEVKGVAHIQVMGDKEPRLVVKLEPKQLKKYKLSVGDVVSAMKESLVPVEYLRIMGHRVSIKGMEEIHELGNIPLRSGKNIYLRDVGTLDVEDAAREHAHIAQGSGKSFRSKRGVFVLVHVASGKLTPLAHEKLDKFLKELQDHMPTGIRLVRKPIKAHNTSIMLRLPETLSLEQREEKIQAAAKAMLELSDVHNIFWLAQPHSNEVVCWVEMHSGNQTEVHRALRARLASIKGVSSRVGEPYSPLFPWPGEGSLLAVNLPGKDLARLHQKAEKLCQRLRKIRGIVDVERLPQMGSEASIDVDRAKASLSGVSMSAIVRTLAAHADKRVLSLDFFPWHLKIDAPGDRVKSPKRFVEELATLPINGINPDVNLMIRDVARVRLISVPTGAILHEDGRPCVLVFASLEGRELSEVLADLKRAVKEVVGTEIQLGP